MAIERLPGVETVEVSLNSGTASIVLEAGNTVRLENLREIVENYGFTARQAEVTVEGDTVGEATRPRLLVRGTGDEYALSLANPERFRPNQPTRVIGTVPAPDDGEQETIESARIETIP